MIPPATTSPAVVTARALTKIYQRGREQVRAVDQVEFEISAGEFVAITGPSGAGKTTLLNLMGCLEAPTSGTLRLLDKSVHELTDAERTRLRRERIGFVFQHFGLLSTLTVAENIALPGLFARRPNRERVTELLAKVGLERRRAHRPRELSGGEMQRAAIARALVNQPALLLADEPTGNLDTAMGESIIALFQELNREGLTVVVVTHNVAVARMAHRQLHMADGKLVGGSAPPAGSAAARVYSEEGGAEVNWSPNTPRMAGKL
jgi:putative ABC transport system ATP-binding protein